LLKLIEKALREHRAEPGEVTGFVLITFRDGEAMITAEVSDGDEAAQNIVAGLGAALEEGPDDDDEIGPCAGQA
jgi:hypothetical protein